VIAAVGKSDDAPDHRQPGPNETEAPIGSHRLAGGPVPVACRPIVASQAARSLPGRGLPSPPCRSVPLNRPSWR
jgi:hypothetical protein